MIRSGNATATISMYSGNRPPLAISHRGLHTTAAENTIPAFLQAIEAGAEGIELDVHASADDIPYVHHDAYLTLDGEQIPFSSLDSTDIRKTTLVSGESIPSLDDALGAIGHRADVFIEVKATGIEQAVARCVRRHAPNTERYAIHAFDHRIVRKLLALLPSVRSGILQVSYLVDTCAALRNAGALDLWQHADFVDASLVIDAHSCGARVIAWTPNFQLQWQHLASIGVDGICTDRVDAYTAWLRNLQPS